MVCKGEPGMKGTCYSKVSCLQWKAPPQLFRFGSHPPVVAAGMLSSVCQTDALLRNGFASFDEINRQIHRYFHALPKTLFLPFLPFSFSPLRNETIITEFYSLLKQRRNGCGEISESKQRSEFSQTLCYWSLHPMLIEACLRCPHVPLPQYWEN